MRLFLAINLADDVRRAIIDGTASLREAAPEIRWVDDTRLHLTLKFLGEQPEDVVRGVSDAMDRVAQRHRSFTISVGDIGAFPNFRRARVVWMGIPHEPRLELLHHDVEVACEGLGFELEGRSFRPHLTLARVREETPEATLRTLSRSAKRTTFAATAHVDSIDVMRSNPGRAGPRYERLHAAHLRPD